MKNSNITFSSFNPFRFSRTKLISSFCLALALGAVSCRQFATSKNEGSKSTGSEHSTSKKMTEKWTYDEIAKKLVFQYGEQTDTDSAPDGTRVYFQWNPKWPKVRLTI
jgi:hypothetical protein